MLRVMQRGPNSHQAPAPLLYHSGRITAPPVPSMDPNHFPSRLHEMLGDSNDSGNGISKIVSWQPHGKCFMIRDKEQFISKVLPKLKFTTFERQLHKHGFRKLGRKGPDQGAYYHPKFVRELPDMAKTIHHTNIKGKRGRKPKSKLSEPDFYNPDVKLPAEDPQEASGEGPGDAFFKQKSSIGVPAALRHDSPKTSAHAARASTGAARRTANFDLQASINQSLLSDSSFAEGLSMGTRSSQSLLSPSTMQHDTLASASQPYPPQLSSYFQQQQQLPMSLRNPQLATPAAAVSDEQVPVPVLARQSSDFSISGGLGLFGLGDSPPDDPPTTFASLEAFTAAQASQQQPSVAAYPDSNQQRINDLIFRNQQQQRNLQLQQQQLEQQRLELHLRQQQQSDIAGRQTMGQSLSGSSYQQQIPLSSSSFLLREQQQQLQHYQNQLSNQQALSLGLQSRQQQDQGQGQQQDPTTPQNPFHNPHQF